MQKMGGQFSSENRKVRRMPRELSTGARVSSSLATQLFSVLFRVDQDFAFALNRVAERLGH